MFRDQDKALIIKNSESRNTSLPSGRAERLTALWALSESTLGGILHALKFPFRGMIISGAAVILISLIANFSDKKNQILKSTIIVILVKAIISPHTPLTAYLSVFLQGLIGEILFLSRKFRFLSALLLGILVALLNGFQKILVLTIIYGQTLWRTIDDFINYINKEWLFTNIENPINFSAILILSYIGIHLIAGLIAGVLAYRIPKFVKARLNDVNLTSDFNKIRNTSAYQSQTTGKVNTKRKRKYLKPSAIIIFSISIIILITSYFYTGSEYFDVNAIMIMLARSVIIIFIWFYFIAPRIKRFMVKRISSSKNKYSKEAESVISALPIIKEMIISIWKYSASYPGIKRISFFIKTALVYLIYTTEENL